MNNIYDNGTMLLGTIKNIKEYTNKQIEQEEDTDIQEEYKSMLEEIESLEEKDNTIIAINYDNGMGISIDYWQESDKVVE